MLEKFTYNKKTKILEVKTSGIIVIGDIINHCLKTIKDDSLPKNLKILVDCRNTLLNVKADEISLSHDALENAHNKYDSIQEAILVDKPNETVVAMLFKDSIEFENFSFGIFCTESAARLWLK